MRSSRHHFDLIVIGSGPGGQRAATQAAKLRKRVAICERRRDVGGNSINSGTVPSKHLDSERFQGWCGGDSPRDRRGVTAGATRSA
jgi:pyruvate/2-oxoglutarate dehydrogenase complex dihydrolipoamide dehydrogenase (E3) component